MVSILKDIPIDGVKIVPCRCAVGNRGVVKSFLVAGQDRVILVDTDDTCAAIKDVFEDPRSILEPAGALAIAGAKRYVEQNRYRWVTSRTLTDLAGAEPKQRAAVEALRRRWWEEAHGDEDLGTGAQTPGVKLLGAAELSGPVR